VQTIVQSECIVRGDLANINVGRQCVVGKRAVITPPFKKLSHGYAYKAPVCKGSPTHYFKAAIWVSLL